MHSVQYEYSTYSVVNLFCSYKLSKRKIDITHSIIRRYSNPFILTLGYHKMIYSWFSFQAECRLSSGGFPEFTLIGPLRPGYTVQMYLHHILCDASTGNSSLHGQRLDHIIQRANNRPIYGILQLVFRQIRPLPKVTL